MMFPARWTKRFTCQLAMLLEEGVSPFAALDLIRLQQRGKAGKRILAGILARLEAGASLPEALAFYPRQFNRSYTGTIKWAESTGSADNLAIALRLLAGDTVRRTPRVVPVIDPATSYAMQGDYILRLTANYANER